jgi:hypothetical protein
MPDNHTNRKPASKGDKTVSRRFLVMGVVVLAATGLVGLVFSPSLQRLTGLAMPKYLGGGVPEESLPIASSVSQNMPASKDEPAINSARRLEETRQGEVVAKKPPFLELQRIIPFGRSLELIGRVDPGSSLAINDETVEVTGDGSFKHFTKQFPPSAQKASLILKLTDLAGRTRVERAVHDFGIGEQEE